jgi:hypothetical protein
MEISLIELNMGTDVDAITKIKMYVVSFLLVLLHYANLHNRQLDFLRCSKTLAHGLVFMVHYHHHDFQ